jgi:superfamily II DNA or RNA helicase
MAKLTRTGYLIPIGDERLTETKKDLTVRPVINGDFGFPPPAFKVFRASKDNICVPRFYGLEKYGEPKDKRPEPAKANIHFTGKLRDETFQNEALKKAIDAGSGVLSLPCGFGKTTVALAIAARLGLRTMIVVHKEFLANQWRERIQQFCPGSTIGIVQQDKVEIECDFVIAMLQSLSLKEYTCNQFESIGSIFIDEAHHVCARVFSQSLFKLCPKHAFGLSATPVRKDGLTKVLHWFLGPTFFSVERKNQEQVEVFTKHYTCQMFHDPPPCNRCGKVSLVQMITDLVENTHRNGMLVDLMRKIITGTTRQLLVLSDRRLHCEYLHSQFPDDSGLYMGGMKEAALLDSSKKRIIIGTFSQAHEGLDIPTLDTVILATPKSDIKQSIGRILRETTGKKNVPHIYDMCDEWSLLFAMYQKRRRVYKEGGFLIHDKPPKEADDFPRGKCLLKVDVRSTC